MSEAESSRAPAPGGFRGFDIEPADVAYLRSLPSQLDRDIQEWVVAQWRAEVEMLPWFAEVRLTPEEQAAVWEFLASLVRRLLSGDRVEELYGLVEQAALVALQRGVRSTDIFQASIKLESVLTGLILQLFPGSDEQTVALVTLGKFLKALVYAVMETYRREAAQELERRNRDLTAALEQQTATAEILGVISRSHTDLQPVLDAIARNAFRLCRATAALAVTVDGPRIHLGAVHGVPAPAVDALRSAVSASGRDAGPIARALLDGTVASIRDAGEIRDPLLRAMGRAARVESALSVPMLLKGRPVGGITVTGGGRSAPSRRRTWSSSGPSRTRPSSPARTCGCSRSCRRAPPS
jgi:hypothetical protein